MLMLLIGIIFGGIAAVFLRGSRVGGQFISLGQTT